MTIRSYSLKRRVVTSSSFSELITTQLRDFHMVSPQVVFNLLIFLTMQSYKFYIDIVMTNGGKYACLFYVLRLNVLIIIMYMESDKESCCLKTFN